MSKLVNLSHLKKALNRVKTYFNNKISEVTTKLSEDLTTTLTPDWLTNVRNRTHYLGNLLATLDNSNRSTYLLDSYADYGFYVVVDGVSTSTKITNLTPHSETRYSLPASNSPNITLHVNYVPDQFVHVAFTQHTDSIQHKILIYGHCQPLSDVYIPETIARKTDVKPLIEIKYEDLKNLRDNNKLIPGRQYCITDYVTTTTQRGTSAVNNTFDIIVTANNTNILNEEARVRKSSINPINVMRTYGAPIICRLTGTEMVIDNITYYQWDTEVIGDSTIVLSKTMTPSINEEIFTLSSNGNKVVKYGNVFEIIDYFENSNLEAWKIWYCLDNDTERFDWAASYGTGVIYRMIDEHDNDCPYDFKNIRFARKKAKGGKLQELAGNVDALGGKYVAYTQGDLPAELEIDDSADTVYYYTFEDGNNGGDYSVTKENGENKCYKNKISFAYESQNKTKQVLNDVVLCSKGNITTNVLNTDCKMMTFYTENDIGKNFLNGISSFNILVSSRDIGNNNFDTSFNKNLISNYNSSGMITYNNLKSKFYDNIIIGSFGTNDIGVTCYNNTIIGTFANNSISHNFHDNYIYDSFQENTIGTSFNNNIIETLTKYNVIHNYFNSNKITKTYTNSSDGFVGNIVYESCEGNLLDYVCGCVIYNSFRNNRVYHAVYCTFNSVCKDNIFGTEKSKETNSNINMSTFGKYLTNNIFSYTPVSENNIVNKVRYLYVQNNIQGTKESPNNITLPVNLDVETHIGKNSKGEIKIYVPADLVE